MHTHIDRSATSMAVNCDTPRIHELKNRKNNQINQPEIETNKQQVQSDKVKMHTNKKTNKSKTLQ